MVKSSFSSGFQGSEATSVDVILYSHADDPQLPKSGNRIVFQGLNERSFAGASVVSVSTSKKMGAAAGQFTLTLKAAFDLSQLIVDDDWVDIVFNRHGAPYHTMRGLVRDLKEVESVSGSGTTTKTFTITGSEWSSIFDRTPIWFNTYAAENAGQEQTLVMTGARNVTGAPDVTVGAMLFGFMETLSGLGRSNWELPPTIPGWQDNILDAIEYNTAGFANVPERIAIDPQFMDPKGVSVWNIAKEWSDPMFCELWCDLGDGTATQSFDGRAGTIPAGKEVTPDDTKMAVYFRDRPFLTTQKGSSSPWLTLPTLELPPTHISRKDLGRGGNERYNGYFVTPRVIQSLGGKSDLQSPLWDVADIRRHGLRRFDVQSRYLSTTQANLFAMSQEQRYLVRDWHCLNPYLWNGTLALGRLYPDLRLGMRLRVTGNTEEDQWTFYVEEVGHTWQKPQGGRTSVGVTRGYKGSDSAQLAALYDQAERYTMINTRGRTVEPDFGFS